MTKTDDALIRLAAKGDTDAFEKLLLQHQGMVYNLALRMAGNREDALDISQEAFLKVWRALPRFREESSFSTWLYRITVNAANDYLSQRKRCDVLPMEGELSDETRDPTEELLRSERADELTHALAALSPEHREIVILRDAEGYSYGELSAMLNLEPGTVKSRLNRARGELRRLLSEAEQK